MRVTTKYDRILNMIFKVLNKEDMVYLIRKRCLKGKETLCLQ
jgi:hypothetical protein